MKWFISSDIHSFYDEWRKALSEKGFEEDNPNHGIIVLGDLLDRGTQPLECLQFANKMYKASRAILIKGNHEWLLKQMLDREYIEGNDEHNGTYDTANILCKNKTWSNDRDLCRLTKKNRALKYYLNHLVNYAELDDNIFVHGWLPLVDNEDDNGWPAGNMHIMQNWRDQPDWVWEEASWYNGMFQWHKGNKLEGKTIWCGHWNASFGNSYYHNDGVEFLRRIETYYIDPKTGKIEPHVNNHTFIDDGIRALDATTVLSGLVNVEVLEI